MAKQTIRFINVPIFNDEYNVIIAFGDAETVKGVMRAVGHSDGVGEISWDADYGATMLTPGVTPVIAMPSRPVTPHEWGTMAHEACHAVEELFRYINQPLGGEVFAHSVGAVVRAAAKEMTVLKV